MRRCSTKQVAWVLRHPWTQCPLEMITSGRRHLDHIRRPVDRSLLPLSKVEHLLYRLAEIYRPSTRLIAIVTTQRLPWSHLWTRTIEGHHHHSRHAHTRSSVLSTARHRKSRMSCRPSTLLATYPTTIMVATMTPTTSEHLLNCRARCEQDHQHLLWLQQACLQVRELVPPLHRG